jgi:MFS family permease
MEANRAPDFRFSSLVWPIYLPGVLCALCRTIELTVLPLLILSDLEAGDTLLGTTLALDGLGGLCFSVPSGWITGKIGPRAAGACSMLLYGFLSLACCFAPTIWWLLPLRFACGASYGLFNIARQVWMASMVPNAKRGRSIALLGGLAVSRGS